MFKQVSAPAYTGAWSYHVQLIVLSAQRPPTDETFLPTNFLRRANVLLISFCHDVATFLISSERALRSTSMLSSVSLSGKSGRQLISLHQGFFTLVAGFFHFLLSSKLFQDIMLLDPFFQQSTCCSVFHFTSVSYANCEIEN